MRLLAFILLMATATGHAQSGDDLTKGRAQLHRWNCAACHSGLPSGSSGPDLTHLASRLDAATIEKFLLQSATLKPTSRHPQLLSPDKPTAQREATALAAYFHSFPLPTPAPAPIPPGDPKRGKSLFTSIGCLACHPPSDHKTLEPPLFHARAYPPAHLFNYLLQPHTSLMPSLQLSEPEAADLAAWIQTTKPKPIERPPAAKSSPRSIALGRKLFQQRNCITCHNYRGQNAQPLVPGAAIVDWKSGCFSPTPSATAPSFPLNQKQRQAIQSAASAGPPTPAQFVHQFLTNYHCYSCHQRGGLGGPADELRPFFKATEQMAESYGDFGTMPPKLDFVGRKLTRSWLRKILVEGHGEVRPYLATRMPHYRIPEEELAQFIKAIEEADRRKPPITIDVTGLPGHQRGHYGRDLIGSKGLNCITCHGLKDRKALGAPNIDLTHTVQRLRPAYFKELLLEPPSLQPGTLMPPLFLNRPKANQEIEQLWTYLKELDQRRLPDGLLKKSDFELKPNEVGKPIVLRTFLEKVGTHAIAVGFPGGTHLAFDSRTSQWALVWKGRFLDAMSTWDDRYATPAKPLSENVYRFLPQKTQRQFRGFRLDVQGVPSFLYLENGREVVDRIAPLPTGELRRTITRGNKVTHQRIRLHNRKALFEDEK